MTYISNARMYAVHPRAEAAWKGLIAHIAEDAGVEFEYVTYAAPQPLEQLWRRTDLGCVQMGGFPIALKLASVVPLASPVPAAPWADGEAVYRTDLIVRADAPYETLSDTFDGTIGWTVSHSHSGFNALRYHLLPYRSQQRPNLYRKSVGDLITARNILDAVKDRRIDVGPLDAYWHMLIRKHNPALAENIRVLEATATAPMPAFVAAPALPQSLADRLRDALATARTKSWFQPFRNELLLEGFQPVCSETFSSTLMWDQAAKAAGYVEPA